MNHVRYRLESLPAALNSPKMHGPVVQSLDSRKRRRRIFVAGLIAFAALMFPETHPPAEPIKAVVRQDIPASPSPPATPAPLAVLLADTRADAAKAKLDQHQPGEALAMLVSALKADPECSVARDLAREILTKTTWNFPETTLHHGCAIDHLDFAAPSSLWVSLSGKTNTTVRWNLDPLKIESVLFPLSLPETRSLVFDREHQWVVVERGGTALLCDAKTLRPIRDLGAIPPALTPSSVIAFPPNGLLIAHPVFANADNSAITWLLRDIATGEIVRSSGPSGPNDPLPLAALMNPQALRVLRQDGSLWTMPISPAEPIEVTDAPEKAAFLHARFAETGDSALVLKNLGPHASPTLETLSFGNTTSDSPAPEELLAREPWTLQPSLWNGLLRQAEEPLNIHGDTAIIAGGHAPLRITAPITAAAFPNDRSFIASGDGDITIFRNIPPPVTNGNPDSPNALDPKAIQALGDLTESLAGVSCDDTGLTFTKSNADRRLQAFHDCDFGALPRIFPGLDFQPVIAAFRSISPRTAAPESLAKLTERIARASLVPADPRPQEAIIDAFRNGDADTILAAIDEAGGKGPAAAKALELALASTHPEWIVACLSHATDLPPLLQKLAFSRIAWLQDRKADALTSWPNGFPDLKQVRLSEDWDGWEQADFSPAMDSLQQCLTEQIAALQLPENPTREQRKALFERLSDPLTIKTVGRAHFAKACLDAALAFSAFDDEAESTFKLADVARNLGMDSTPCLRAEALSLTTLGHYKEARDRWVTLLTEHPVETHKPADYAEAAYTSFESQDPRQAVAILTTGMGRFPGDSNFALRAGWVALLTGNAEQAYRYLLAGNRIGYPQEKLENATALMAIAAVQTGAAEDAAAFYQDLINLDPAWEKPETLETLEWPEELKASLRQLVW